MKFLFRRKRKQLGRLPMERLADLTQYLVPCRTSEVINKFLPPKTVNVPFIHSSQYHAFVYCAKVERLLARFCSGREDPNIWRQSLP